VEKDIEIVYLFVGKEHVQMLVHDEEQRKLLLVKRNNFLLLAVLFIKNITLIWHKKSENQ
jgi:hypothetical protein